MSASSKFTSHWEKHASIIAIKTSSAQEKQVAGQSPAHRHGHARQRRQPNDDMPRGLLKKCTCVIPGAAIPPSELADDAEARRETHPPGIVQRHLVSVRSGVCVIIAPQFIAQLFLTNMK